MEPIAPLSKRPKLPTPFDAADAVANGNKFDKLPKSLVHHIFSFMETIDVMRASAVSTRWRYLWTSMPYLDFNYDSFRFHSSGNYDKYKDFINWVLMTHDKSVNIESCRLSCSYNEDDNSVYRWLHILAKKHVQKLYLNLESEPENPFVLPRCLFASDSLEVLEIDLQHNVLKIPSYAGFSQLKSLKLASIGLLDQNSFQNFISSCPLLENLSLNECEFHGLRGFPLGWLKVSIDTGLEKGTGKGSWTPQSSKKSTRSSYRFLSFHSEMESISPLSKCPKFPKSFNAFDAAADGNKFEELPEPVIHHIFSFLDTIDVMRASAVSTRWRYLWTSMPYLDFNYDSFRFHSSGNYDKYKDFINWVLMTHDKSVNIESCRLSCSYNEDDNSVYRWLHILAKKHVQKLYLNLESEPENPFVLPRCLFASDSLEVLEIDLQHNVLKIPSYAGFSQLKSLKLASIGLLDQNSFQNFISSCPLLENLSLNECEFHGLRGFPLGWLKVSIDTGLEKGTGKGSWTPQSSKKSTRSSYRFLSFHSEMESISPLSKCPKFPKSFNAFDAAADGNKFEELPEPVIHHIFSFLDTIDVMRASAVSTRWRYLWTSMPYLDFNYDSFRFHSSGNYDKYKDFINWVLMTHDKSVNIESCRLSCSYNEDDNSVYRWLHILAKKHVQKLYLNLESDGKNPFVLPRCLLASGSLEVLEMDLHDWGLEIPSCAGFSRLKSLKLGCIQLLDQNFFQNLISSCPLLENLSLNDCWLNGCEVLDISLGNLRKLVIESENFEGLEECDLKITCPKLVYFGLTSTVKSLSWGEKPCFLQTAILHFYMGKVNEEFTNSVLEILKGFCHLEILKRSWNILEYISPAVAKPECFSPIFYKLKTLKLSAGKKACYIQSIINLLKCAPNLQRLSIYFEYSKCIERDYECKMLGEDIECLTCHLKMVKLKYIGDSDAELELIRFFLKNAHVLEKMSIIWCLWLNPETQREVIQKVMKFPRSSSHVNVTSMK